MTDLGKHHPGDEPINPHRSNPHRQPINTQKLDEHIGKRITLKRQLSGMTQSELAEQLGLNFQQVQNYEKGKSHLSASRLWYLCKIFNVSVDFFYKDMPEGIASKEFNHANTDIIDKAETLKLVKNYYRIKDPDARKQVFKLCETLQANQ